MAYTPTIWKTGDTVTATKLNKLENGVSDASNAIEQISEETRNLVFATLKNTGISSSGAIETSSVFDVHIAPVTSGEKYTLLSDDSNTYGPFYVYTIYESYPIVPSATHTARSVVTDPVITASTTGYLLLRSSLDAEEVQVTSGEEITEYIPHISATDYVAREEVNEANKIIGEITEKTYNLVFGKIEGKSIDASGKRSNNLPTDLWGAVVEQGKTYTVKTQDTAGLVCGFFTMNPITTESTVVTYNGSRTVQASDYTITAPINGYIAFRSVAGYSDAQIVEGAVDKEYLPPVIAIDSVARQSLTTNILNGKTIVCVGDSITSGADMDSEGYTDDPNITVYTCNDSGVFTPQTTNVPMTYGYQIASRNNMIFYNGGVSGSTMQGISDKNGFSLANGRYTKLPNDIDYLLIWFGWNDAAYGTLGTINDTTNTSFYGAYNVVMPYLINKYPLAKIGLIVPYGATAEHREAVRLLGNKWGVAVWDNYQGGTPLYYGKEDSVGVESSIVTANRAKFQANGAHPNYNGHTQLADMIEGWIKGSLCDSMAGLNAIEQKQDATSYVTLSGTIVTQTGADNTMYLCGELAELTFTAPATGQTAIRFTSGTTPTVATFSGVTWLNGFDPTALEASKTYEVNILNGLGVAAWT